MTMQATDKQHDPEKYPRMISTIFGTLGGSASLSGLARTWAPALAKPASLAGAGLGFLGTTAFRNTRLDPVGGAKSMATSLNPLSPRSLIHRNAKSVPTEADTKQ